MIVMIFPVPKSEHFNLFNGQHILQVRRRVQAFVGSCGRPCKIAFLQASILSSLLKGCDGGNIVLGEFVQTVNASQNN